ncbi:EPIDERMAL PATTERNING FACTOR-like protein 9 [Glycine soja]
MTGGELFCGGRTDGEGGLREKEEMKRDTIQQTKNTTLSIIIQGIRTEESVSQSPQPQREPSLEDGNEAWKMRNSRRLMIGSTAPTCTYNECRGCKYKCRAEQVPVEGNDPINSPYHYRCVCHR